MAGDSGAIGKYIDLREDVSELEPPDFRFAAGPTVAIAMLTALAL
jgi:hypothetical protein